MTYRIVLISSGQPSLNPRLVKEADALVNAGYQVTVLYAYWNDWGTAFDEQLIPEKKWQAIRIAGAPGQARLVYFLSRLIHKLGVIGAQKINIPVFAELAIARSSFMLIRAAKKYQADLYIAHNTGALPAAVKAAKHHRKPCGFDAEDYHRNETSNDSVHFDLRLKTHIENTYIPSLTYLTASSPQITQAYQKNYAGKSPVTILNVFNKPKGLSIKVEKKSTTLKLFWFSQTIGPDRGLEAIIEVLASFEPGMFELHLLGYCTEDFKKHLMQGNKYIYFYNPLPPEQIPYFATQFDIGVAAENNIPHNRDICLTNKLFTYMQAGLAIIASNTTAQLDLLTRYAEPGKVYEINNMASLKEILLYYSLNTQELLKAKRASFDLARKEFNWEKEQYKFLEVVNHALTH